MLFIAQNHVDSDRTEALVPKALPDPKQTAGVD